LLSGKGTGKLYQCGKYRKSKTENFIFPSSTALPTMQCDILSHINKNVENKNVIILLNNNEQAI
jgi:hypothetical protein